MNDNVIDPQPVNKQGLFAGIKVAPNGMAASIILAFLTTAGIFYINIMPAVVNGLKEGIGFSNQQAGFVSSANLYGAAIGALLAVFLVKKINWQRWCYTLLVLLITIDFACVLIESANLMIAVRALHGVTGGLLVGIGFSIISRTAEPDKTFGYLLFIQWGLGGLGIMYLPGLVPDYGTMALFISLVIFSLATLCMMPFLGDYPIPEKHQDKAVKPKVNLMPLTLTLLAIFLFQGANMGLFAYVIGLAKVEGLEIDFISTSLAMASWVALVGPFLVILVGTKYGRTIPIITAIIVTTVCTWLLHYSESQLIYLIANIVIGVAWACVIPYLFGMCSEFDKAGQMAAMGGFASKMGLASGPMVAGLLLGDDNYSAVINIAVVVLILSAIVAFKPAKLLD